MSSKILYEAIALVRSGKKDEARQIIFEIIRSEPENEMAWMWLAETLSSDRDRMDVLNACLKHNPESNIANMAIKKMQEKMEEEGTLNAEEAPRTGQTGALIGFDGAFILSEVSDFDDVIDLRSPSEEELSFMDTAVGIEPAAEDEAIPSMPEESGSEAQIFATPAEAFTEEPAFDLGQINPVESEPETAQQDIDEVDFSAIFQEAQQETEQPAADEDADDLNRIFSAESNEGQVESDDELSFEPDLSSLFEDENIFGEDEEITVVGLAQQSDDDEELDLHFNGGLEDEAEDLIDLDSLSPAELGFEADNEPGETTDEDLAELEALMKEDDLVEEKVLESTVAKNTAHRKKQDKRTRMILAVVFIFIIALCAVAVYVIWDYSQQTRAVAYEPTMTFAPTSTDVPTATLTPTLTVTPTPTMTPTATMTPTPTQIVQMSTLALNAEGLSQLRLRLDEDVPGAFYTSLDGSLMAITDGGDVYVYETERGKELYALDGHDRSITDIAFSDDNRFMLSAASDFTIRLWDLEKGTQTGYTLDTDAINRIYTMENADDFPRDVTVDFSPDGSTIAAGTFGIVSIFDVPTGLQRGTFALTNEDINLTVWNNDNLHGFDVRFNENGWVLTAGMSKLIVGLDTLDATLLYRQEVGQQVKLFFNENRDYFVEHDLGGIVLRSMDSGEINIGFGGLTTEDKPLPEFEVSTNWNRVAIASTDDAGQPQASVWDVFVDWNIINFAGICEEDICREPGFTLSNDGTLIGVEVAGNEGTTDFQVTQIDGLTEIHRFAGLQEGVLDAAFSPDMKLLAVLDGAGTLRVWDLEIGVERASLSTDEADGVDFSLNGQFLYAWNNDHVWVWSQPLPPPDNAFPGIKGVDVESWLLLQGNGTACTLGDSDLNPDWYQVICGAELETYSLTSRYYMDEEGYVFELHNNLVLAEEVELDETIIAAFAYYGGLNFAGAQIDEAKTWIIEQLPTLTEFGNSAQATFGAVHFDLVLDENGYQLKMVVPEATS